MNKEPSALANWTPEQISQGKRWVDCWRLAGEAMGRLRKDELRRTVTSLAMNRLSGEFEAARFMTPVRTDSGLVEMEALLSRWRKTSRG